MRSYGYNYCMNISTKILDSGLKIYFFSSTEFAKLNPKDKKEDFDALRFGVRLNALSMIKVAGSGHVGSSLSAIDLFIAAKLFYLGEGINKNNNQNGILFSSKGHDAPGLYSVLHAFGEVPDEAIFSLRRLGGYPGHPEVGVANVPTNTGSLGMGISKAKGFSYAYNLKNQSAKKIAVILGDGELQEGQIWESLPGASRDNLNNILAVVDGNKIQSDTWVEKTLPLGNLKMRVAGSGWEYLECDGHDFHSLKKSMNLSINSKVPVFLYAHTVKSSGIDFMEIFHPEGNFYKYHSGAPSDSEYYSGALSILKNLKSIDAEKILEISNLISSNLSINSEDFNPKSRNPSLILDWNESLIREFKNDNTLIALDADLKFDTGTYGVAKSFPKRYIQCGIAEQDMVSIAGTLALSGFKPIVHSFASFLTNRSAEQIFNNLTENSQIIYAGFLAGILPSAPGHSHQAVNDVGIISSSHGISIYEPSCKMELEYCFSKALKEIKNTYIRIGSVDYPDSLKKVTEVNNLNSRIIGTDIAIITSGPSMTKIALEVAMFSPNQISVYTRPQINVQFTEKEILEIAKYKGLIVLENYLPALGTYHFLREGIGGSSITIKRIGVESIPRNGQTSEVLAIHGLDAKSIFKEALSLM